MLHRVGVADKDQQLVLHLTEHQNLGLGTFSTIEQYDVPLKPLATCEVVDGGRYVIENGVGHVDAIKIDVQGFEPEVLRGLREILHRDRPIIWVEVAEATSAQMGSLDDMRRLVPFPFEARMLVHRGLGAPQRDGALPFGDYVLFPSN